MYKPRIQIDPTARSSNLVEIFYDNGQYYDEGYISWITGPFAGINHAIAIFKNVLPHHIDWSYEIRPYVKKGTLEELHELFYDRTSQTVQFFDISRQPIPWANGDDKHNQSLPEFLRLIDFLSTFGHHFKSLWDVDARNCWVWTRVYEDGREKYINNRYFNTDVQQVPR